MSEMFQAGFRLGEHRIDPLRGQIERPDGTEHVSPKAMELLLCLAGRAEELVEREELIQCGWGEQAGHDEALTRYIAELRHALRDHHDSPEYIQTIPRRGYRLVAPVYMPEDDSTASGADDPERQAPLDATGIWGELKRRNVIRTSLAYAATAWLVIEVSSVVGEIFDWPQWVLRVLLTIAIIGLPVVAALSWAVQTTPSGLALDMPVLDKPAPATHPLGRKVDMVIIAVLLVAVSFLLNREFSVTQPTEPSSIQAYENSVAVLPFANLSSNAEDEFICDGLAEELLNLLAQMKNTHVTARTASFYFKNKDVALPNIVAALNVKNIIEGSVQRAGNRLRVTVQLIDGETLMHRWSESFETSMQDLLELRDRVARKIAAELEGVISDRGEEVIRQGRGTDPEAYLLYLQARQELRKEHNDESLGAAVSLLEQALAIDARFARAHAGLCDAHLAQYVQSGREQQSFEKAERACHRALTLDTGLSEVHTALGNLYRESGQLDDSVLELGRTMDLDPTSHDAVYALAQTREAQGNPEAAEDLYGQLIEMQPGYWHSYNALGHFLIKHARYSDALAQFSRVIELVPDSALGFNNLGAAHWYLGDYAAAAGAWRESVALKPSNLVLSNIGLADYYAGDYGDAAEMQERALQQAPEDFRLWGRLGDAKRQAGDTESAHAAYTRAIEFASAVVKLNPSDEEALRYISLYYSHTGDSENAVRAIEQARRAAPQSPRVHYFASKVYLGAGDRERAFLELEKSVALGYSIQVVRDDPDLASMRDSGRFQSMLNDARQRGTT